MSEDPLKLPLALGEEDIEALLDMLGTDDALAENAPVLLGEYSELEDTEADMLGEDVVFPCADRLFSGDLEAELETL